MSVHPKVVIGFLCSFLLLLMLACSKKEQPQSSNTSGGNQPSSEQAAAPPTQQPPAAAPENPAPAAAAPAEPASPAKAAAPSKAKAPVHAAAAPKPVAPAFVTLPAGTALTVRTNEAIGSKSSQAGSTFTATFAQPVAYEGKTLIPAGATASGTVETAQQGGKIKGASQLSVRLTQITVHGTPYPVATELVAQEGKSKGGRTAKMGVGGAAGGALIGGLAGGGKGALIGTMVGGAAGTTGSAMTGNKELSIPAESVLTFKLAQPLKVKASSSAAVHEQNF
jgi:hypothetical protein